MRDKVEAEKMEAEEMDSAMNSCESGVSVKRVAVVTGASKGIGFETAKVLVEDGYTVYGLSRSRVLLEGILWKKCDVTDSESVDRVFSEILEENRKIDVLVCNAGIGISGAAEFVSEEDYRLQTDVNFNGAVLCAQAVEKSYLFLLLPPFFHYRFRVFILPPKRRSMLSAILWE